MNRSDIKSYERRRGQYILLIDKAILQKRYKLAVQLANRCLVNYYQIFLRSVQPRYRFRSKNSYLIALRIVKYFKKYSRRKSWFSSQERLFNVLSVSYYLTHYLSSKSEKTPLLFDRASAEYARNNTIAIAQKLVHYLNELKSK
jgi:hypothetical protein